MSCRYLKLFTTAVVAIDSRKFKAVNSRDRNFTPNKIERHLEQIEHPVGGVISVSVYFGIAALR